MPPGRASDLRGLVEQLQQLKDEHRELLRVIGGDAGMAPETRQALLAHLLEEEDELMARIAAASAPGADAPAPGAGAPACGPRAPRLTVGSLRRELAPAVAGLGSLRRR